MTSITGPPLLLRFPLLELGFFRREVTKYRKQNDPIWTRRLAFRRQCIVGDCPVTNGENVFEDLALFVTLCNANPAFKQGKQVYMYEGVNGCSSRSAYTGTCLMFTLSNVLMNLK